MTDLQPLVPVRGRVSLDPALKSGTVFAVRCRPAIPYNAAMLFHFVQIVHWLALSTWFGGVMFVAIAAPVIFRTVRENDPLLPTVLSVNLEGQHGTLLAGSIVANLLAVLVRVEIACAAALLVTTIAQWILVDQAGGQFVSSILRSALYVAAVGIVLYEWRVLSPRIWKTRQEYIDHADEPEVANPAREQFDRYHKESVTLLTVLLGLLLGMVLFSAGLSPASGARAVVFGR